MNMVILHFSARSGGNCAAIARHLRRLHPADSVTIYPLTELTISPCRGCTCQCFTRADACPHAQDDVRRLYQAITDAELAYFILPNYADCPPALYFAFNERSNCFFQGNEALLNAYLAVPKRFIIVSNRQTPIFDALPQYHIAEGAPPKLLYLPPRQFSKSSLDGDMMEADEAKALLEAFVDEINCI